MHDPNRDRRRIPRRAQPDPRTRVPALPAFADEYAQKLNAASAHFAELVRRATGVPVANPWPYASLERVSDGRFVSVLHCAKRSAAALRSAASGKSDPERDRLSAAASAWTRARESLGRI